MKVYLLRHGRTRANESRQYQGRRGNAPLSPQGRAELRRAGFSPEVLWVSPQLRARETAQLLFPGTPQRVVEDLAEMDFGVFEGRSALEMETDGDYRRWVQGGCRGRCPEGEDLEGFCRRVRLAFQTCLEEAKGERLALVAHGGTLCALMEAFALPQADYFTWFAPNGGGYLLELEPELWLQRRRLRLLERVCWAGEKGEA